MNDFTLENFNKFKKIHESDIENIKRLCIEGERKRKMLKILVNNPTQEQFNEIKNIVDKWV